MIDPRPLWDFDDPASSGERFLDAAEQADEPDRTSGSTQYVRALGLQERYDEADRMLDWLASDDPEAATYLGSSVAACCGRRVAPTRRGHSSSRPSRRPGRPASTPSTSTRCTWSPWSRPAEEQLGAEPAGARGCASVDRPAGPRLGRVAAEQHRHDPADAGDFEMALGVLRGGARRS